MRSGTVHSDPVTETAIHQLSMVKYRPKGQCALRFSRRSGFFRDKETNQIKLLKHFSNDFNFFSFLFLFESTFCFHGCTG